MPIERKRPRTSPPSGDSADALPPLDDADMDLDLSLPGDEPESTDATTHGDNGALPEMDLDDAALELPDFDIGDDSDNDADNAVDNSGAKESAGFSFDDDWNTWDDIDGDNSADSGEATIDSIDSFDDDGDNDGDNDDVDSDDDDKRDIDDTDNDEATDDSDAPKKSVRSTGSHVFTKVSHASAPVVGFFTTLLRSGSKIPVLGKVIAALEKNPVVFTVAACLIPVLIVAGLLWGVRALAVGDPSVGSLDLPDEGHVVVTDASVDKLHNAVEVELSNDGAVIAENVTVKADVQASTFNPATWFSPDTVATCEPATVESIDIEGTATVTLTCENIIGSFAQAGTELS